MKRFKYSPLGIELKGQNGSVKNGTLLMSLLE